MDDERVTDAAVNRCGHFKKEIPAERRYCSRERSAEGAKKG